MNTSVNASVNTSVNASVNRSSIDTRATVGHLSRNIRIIGVESSNESNWGFRLLVFRYIKCQSVQRYGSLVLDSVELRNGGQGRYSQKPAIEFYSNALSSNASSITNSTVFGSYECGLLIQSQVRRDLRIAGNIFAKGKIFHIKVNTASIQNLTI